jgi:nucleoside phosphorylase
LPTPTAATPRSSAPEIEITDPDAPVLPLPRLPQMPTYHLKRPANQGITLVNIGIGPSNAKTATDHIAVLRPHAWLMVGHCAGLRNSQSLGDFVLAHAYLREDHVLDDDLPSGCRSRRWPRSRSPCRKPWPRSPSWKATS